MPSDRVDATPPAAASAPSPGLREVQQGARPDALAFAACAAITFLAFLPVLGADFVATWDDGSYILHNESIRDLSLETLFGFHSSYWAPMTWLSFALDYGLWGLQPFGFHLANLLLHALDAGLAFLVAREVLALPAIGLSGRALRWTAVLAALAWSLHPQRVESVAWASQRKDVLSLAFGLAAVLAWLAHARSGAPFWRSRGWALSLAAFTLSALSKPTMVTLPLALLILDVYPLRRGGAGRWGIVLLEKAPFLAVAAVVTGFTVAAHSDVAMPLAEAGLTARALIALRSILDYLRQAILPLDLSPFYLHPGDVGLTDLAYVLPAAVVIAATATAAWAARSHPAAAAVWFLWLLGLAPGLMSTQVSVTERADRFTYLAALPLTVLAAAAGARWLAGRSPRVVRAGAVTAACALLLLAGLTWRQTGYWHDDVALWSRPIELDPRRSGRVYTQRSLAREERGDLSGARADMDEAIAIAAGKAYGFMHQLYARRARLEAGLGQLPEAIDDLGRALETDATPGRADTLRARAALFRAIGQEALAAVDEQAAAGVAAGR